MDTHFSAQSGRVKVWFTRPLRFLAFMSGLFVLFTLPVAAQPKTLVVSTVAGLANFGSADGIGSTAKFLLPTSVAVDGAGNVYVADTANDTIREITSAGVVTTLAGMEQMPGTNDGTGSAARFNQPYGVAVDSLGNIYVADSTNFTIRKITTNGSVTTIAGQIGHSGSSNGPALNGAQFLNPYGVAVDSSNNIYVADTGNNMIRKIANGNVTTLAGSGSPGTSNGIGTNAQFNSPYALATDSAGDVYVADTRNYRIRRITPAGVVTTLAGNGSVGINNGTNAQFAFPTGIAVDSATNIYVADYTNQIIRKITLIGANWFVSTLAGGGFSGDEPGDGDGIFPQATFYFPWGLAVDSATNLYVGDSGNGNIRKITPGGIPLLSTLAGADGSYGLSNGPAAQARFNQPFGVAVDGATNLYVADYYNNGIREVTAAGGVTTLAGSINGDIGSADGTNNHAGFYYPSGLCADAATNLYVADSYNSTVRKITPDAAHSNWVTTTIAGQVGIYSFINNTNGTNATFYVPSAVAVDSATNLYVADTYNNAIRMITTSGAVSTYAGNPNGNAGYKDATGTNALFNQPNGIAVDGQTNVYVADSGNNAIRQITPGRAVTTLTNGAFLNFPEGVAADSVGNVYVANSYTNTILGIPHGAKSMTNIAGTAGLTGSADGLGTNAQFYTPIGLALDASGNVYVADVLNNTIRKGTPYTAATVVLTLTTSPSGLPLEVNGINYASTPQVLAFASNSMNTNTATSTNDYAFTNWTVNGSVASTSNVYAFTLGSNETLVANFLPGYNLAVSASPANGGTVSGGGTFLAGSTNAVTATATNGFIFTNWTVNGSVVSTSSPYNVTLSSNETLVANFLPLYTVTVSASPTNGGTVSPGGTNVSGSVISVNATNNSGYVFAGWTSNGIAVVSSNNYTFTLSTNVTLVADFLPLYTITVSAFPTNGGTVSGGGTFVAGSTNTVTATATNGYLFANWTTNGIVASISNNYSFTLNGNESLVANFVTPTLFITQSNGMTFLFWTNSATGLALESTTNLNPAVWAVVTNPAPALSGGFYIVSNLWSDPMRFFQLVSPTYTLAVSASPTIGGTVSSGGTFAAGSITVTATATNGFLFTNWTQGGIVESTSTNYTFILDSNESLVANFLATSPPLLSITQSNGVTFLFWPNATNLFNLESTTNLNPPNWAVVSNPPPSLSGGFFTESNTWPDQTRYFQLISQ